MMKNAYIRRSAAPAVPAVAVPSTVADPTRAPALYCEGYVGLDSSAEPFLFRLPVPPAWEDRRPTAWAAERRARRAYFTALDALRTGSVDAVESAKVDRLHEEVRSETARATLRHFRRILATVRTAGQPILPTPPAPLTTLVITAPPSNGSMAPEALAERYRWALDWMSARRYIVAKDLHLEWQVRSLSRPLSVPSRVWSSTAKELRRSGRS